MRPPQREQRWLHAKKLAGFYTEKISVTSPLQLNQVDIPLVAIRYDGSMIHEILPVGSLACNCSVIGDEMTREAMVIGEG
jgi:hypothetical protein